MKFIEALVIAGITIVLSGCGANDDTSGDTGEPEEVITEPELTEVAGILSTADRSPAYQFDSPQTGIIRSVGSCQFPEAEVVVGLNTIILDPLVPGTYTDCAVKFYQESQLVYSLPVTPFTILETELNESILIGDTLVTTPVYEFSSNAISEIRSEGTCSFTPFTSIVGTNTLEFEVLAPGTYSDCKINSFQDDVLVATLDVSEFTVHDGLLIEELSAISDTSVYSPEYEFSISVNGDIRSAGSCSFTGFNVTTGPQSILFDPLAPGTYSDCKIELYQQGILKDSLAVTEFTILPFAPEGFAEVTLNDRAYKQCPHTYIVPDARDPLTEDPDADGWGSVCELAAGTDPNNADSDGDGFIDAADEHPLNPMLPDPSGVKSCSAGEAFDITFEMPLPSVCSYNHCTQGVNYGYGEDLSGSIKLRLQVPENFNGSMVFNETHNRTSWLTDPDINNPTTDAYFTFENPAFSALLDEGFALVSPLSLTTPEGRFDFPEALMPSRVEMNWGYTIEWAQRVIEQAYCSDSSSSLLLGSGLKSRYIHTRVERTYLDTGRTATHFDGVVLADGFYASLVTLGDVWLFHNLAFFYSDANWVFGDLNAPELTIPASSIGFHMVLNYAAAFTDFVRVVAGHPDAEHWRASGLQQVFGLSLYSLNKLKALGGAAALASNSIPNTITHTLTTEEVLLLDRLGLDTVSALTNLNNAFVMGSPAGRAIIDSYDFVGGNLQVPAIFHVNPMNLHSMSAQSAGLYKMMLESKGKSHLLRLHVSTSNSDMPDSDSSVLVNEMNLLKTWVEDGIAPPQRGGDTEYVLPEWRMTPIPSF
ncbi:hypothetical protein [Thalassolituus sp.]|uniref:hypothetical protein n=1 Tax=Thalassolituus sp. TaxID=2030822 RepID=UPI00351865C5